MCCSPLYRVVFFTFQFYRFPAVTTERSVFVMYYIMLAGMCRVECIYVHGCMSLVGIIAIGFYRLLLSGLNSDSQLNVTSIHILTKLSRIDSVCGYQVSNTV